MKLTILLSFITSITFAQEYNFGENTKRNGNYKNFQVVDGKISAFSTNYKYKYRTELKTLDINRKNLEINELEVVKSGGHYSVTMGGDLNGFKNNLCYLQNTAYFLVNETTKNEVKILLREVGNRENEIIVYNTKLSGLEYSKILKMHDKYILSVKIQNDDIDGSIILTFDNEFNLINEVESNRWLSYNDYYEIDGKIYFFDLYGGNSNQILIPTFDLSVVDSIKYEFEKDFIVLNYSFCQNKMGDVFLGCIGLTNNSKEPYGLKVFKLGTEMLSITDEVNISADMYFADLDEKSKKKKLNYFTTRPVSSNRELNFQKSELKSIKLSNGSNAFVFMENHYFLSSQQSPSSAEENGNFIVFQIDEEGQIKEENVLRHNVSSIGVNREIASFYVFEGTNNSICIITNENAKMFDSNNEFIPKIDLGKSSYFGYAPFKNTVGTIIKIQGSEVEREIITKPKSILAPSLVVELEPGKLLLYQFSKKSESFGILSNGL